MAVRACSFAAKQQRAKRRRSRRREQWRPAGARTRTIPRRLVTVCPSPPSRPRCSKFLARFSRVSDASRFHYGLPPAGLSFRLDHAPWERSRSGGGSRGEGRGERLLLSKCPSGALNGNARARARAFIPLDYRMLQPPIGNVGMHRARARARARGSKATRKARCLKAFNVTSRYARELKHAPRASTRASTACAQIAKRRAGSR